MLNSKICFKDVFIDVSKLTYISMIVETSSEVYFNYKQISDNDYKHVAIYKNPAHFHNNHPIEMAKLLIDKDIIELKKMHKKLLNMQKIFNNYSVI